MKQLPASFYLRDDVVQIARELIGCLLVTRFDGIETIGRIVETEAYNGVTDRASHAYGGRRTSRTEIMYREGGVAYVYLCYGMHHLFNVVTGKLDVPQAVLIRAVEPLSGIDEMMRRRNKKQHDHSITKGPGSLAQALGIHTMHTGLSLHQGHLFLADDGVHFSEKTIIATPRIGVEYAGEDALLPYRFSVQGNHYVSGKKATLS